MRRLVIVASILLVLPILAVAEEEVTLEFDLAKGDQYFVRTLSKTSTEQSTQMSGQNQEESEVQDSDVTHLLEILEVTETGNYHCRMTTQTAIVEKKAATGSFKLSMRRTPEGEKEIDIQLEQGTQGEALLKKVLNILGEDLLDLRVEFVMTRTGEIKTSRIIGSFLDELPADPPELEFVGKMMKILLPREEFAKMAVGDGIPLFAGHAVGIQGNWPVPRQVKVAGLTLDSQGTGTLEAVEGKVAKVVEQHSYSVDATGLAGRTKSLIKLMYGQMGIPGTIDLDFESPKPLDVQVAVDFDMEDGCVTKMVWGAMKMEIKGDMVISVMGETQSAKMKVAFEATSSVEWKRK